jgi:arsenate reductase
VTVDAVQPTPDATGPIRRRVIFVSSGNAARGLMAEALLRRDAGGQFEVVSGGIGPLPVHSMAIAAMERVGIDTSACQSKSVMRFAAQPFDYVITVCDRARSRCPVFPSVGEQLHWGIDDPAEVEGDEAARQAAYDRALRELSGRIRSFVAVETPRAG